MSWKRLVSKGLMYAALLAYVVFLAFPLFWMLSTSLKPPQEIAARVPTLLPKAPTLAHYVAAFEEQSVTRAIFNSFKVASLSAVVTVIVTLPAAYAIARYRSRITKAVQGWVVISQIFPFILIIVPLFLILRALHLNNTHAGLVIVYLVWSMPFTLWMLQGYVRSIPVALEEAAAVDGATRWQILWRIVAPLLLPGVVAATLFTFISAWNEFQFALVVLKDPKLATLPITLAKFTGVDGTARWGPLAASSLIATLPSLLLFSFIQRGLTAGLVAGSVKQ
ncbi:MAG TPA: carbohydrate ABC transporter permease [Symbiobacteriaceae bacterium]